MVIIIIINFKLRLKHKNHRTKLITEANITEFRFLKKYINKNKKTLPFTLDNPIKPI